MLWKSSPSCPLRFITKAEKGRLHLKCDGTRAENTFRLSTKRTSTLKSAGVSVQSTTGSRVVRISGSNAGCTMFRGSVKGTGYTLHSPVFPSLPLPCVAVCHHISTGLYSVILPVGFPTTPDPGCTGVLGLPCMVLRGWPTPTNKQMNLTVERCRLCPQLLCPIINI